MRVGLVFDLFDDYPWAEGAPPDADAEFEPVETVEALAAALRALGHVPVEIGTARDLLDALPALDVQAVVNIAEGGHTRNREGYVPVLLELAGIPFLGSDALTLSLSLDKAWTKDLAAAAGVPTPAYRTYRSVADVDETGLPGPYPLFVKPRYEGSAMGITAASKVSDIRALREQVEWITSAYRQDALAEVFVGGGGEFTVCVVGNDPPQALPVLQRAVERTTGIGLHALEHRGVPAGHDWDYELEGALTPDLERRLQRLAVRVYEKLDCKDFARADFRVDETGAIWFIEINPLPTFAPDGTFAIVAELMGKSYPDFLAEVLQLGFSRLQLR